MSSGPYQKGWVPEPGVELRGTANILYTCFFTIFACTWTALHLNVPHRDFSPFGRMIRKVQWMVIAVLAPEYISLTALVQRSSTVVALSHMWPLEDRSRPLVFYALMGGFELRFDDETYHRLTYSEFRGLVRAKLVDPPSITTEEVEDKSKGNWFSKLLALLQIGWFVLQLLGRVAQGLQTTPLELFTLGVVACTLVSYINWWAKPLDVNTSTAISVASAYTLSKQAFFAPLETYRLKEGTSGSKSELWLDGLRAFVPSTLGHRIYEQHATGSFAADLKKGTYDDRQLPTFLSMHLQDAPRDVVELLGGIPLLTPEDIAAWEKHRDGIAALRSIDRAASHIDSARWGRRRDLLIASGMKKKRSTFTGPRPAGFWSDAFFEDRVIHTSSSLGLMFTSLGFGACHLLAWNYGFPSSIERVLWRVTSIACTVIPMILLVVDNGQSWLNEKEKKSKPDFEKKDQSGRSTNRSPRKTSAIKIRFVRISFVTFSALFSGLTSYTTSLLILILYITLRLYLVLAILISLRLVPASVYVTVDWSRYIPHFG